MDDARVEDERACAERGDAGADARASADVRSGVEPAHHEAQGAGDPPRQRERRQRSFLGVFDRLLKAMQLDYARADRFPASGYSDFAGKLYTLNSSMFQNAAFCDRTLTQMILHYLAWFQDPGLQLVVGPGAAWHVRQDFRTQRLGDALWVTWAAPGAPVVAGERVVGVNGSSLDEIRPEIERTLWTTVEPPDSEREDWSVVLAFARHLTVEGVDGARRTVRLDVTAGDAAWARAAGTAGAVGPGASGGSAACAPSAPDHAVAGPELGACCEFTRRGEASVLTLRNPRDPGFASALADALPAARTARYLVIDVRGCRGGTQQDACALVPLVLAPGAVATPERLFGRPGIAMNYSQHNVDAKLVELAAMRARLSVPGAAGAPSDPEGLADLDEVERDLRAKRGAGVVREMTGPDDGFYPDGTFTGVAAAGEDVATAGRSVVVLADRFTGEAAEWLVRAAKRGGFACVMGRATLGSLDETCPRVIALDEDFTLVVPTATYVEAIDGEPTLGRGIAPDVHLPWTEAQLTTDGELDAACARACE